jgi:hypothetical protein
MRYIVIQKDWDSGERQYVYGVWDRVRAVWVVQSYSQVQAEADARYLQHLADSRCLESLDRERYHG